MECAKCLLTIEKDNLRCSGFCNGMFHYACASIDRVSFNKSLKFRNIMWFCDDCCVLLENNCFRKLLNSSDGYGMHQLTLANLVEEVADITKLLNKLLLRLTMEHKASGAVVTTPVNELLHPTISVKPSYAAIAASSLPTTSVSTTLACTNTLSGDSMKPLASSAADTDIPSSNFALFSPITSGIEVTPFEASTSVTTSMSTSLAFTSTSGHRTNLSPIMDELEVTPISAVPNVNVTTPVSGSHANHLKPICGTNPIPIGLRIKKVSPRFWIHLSRFDPSTSVDDIVSMANMCLESNNCVARKLVPKNCELNDLEYICFILGINEELREKALCSDTWPAGIFIRPSQSNFRKSGLPRAKFRTTPIINATPV